MAWMAICAIVLLCNCATSGDPGGGAEHLPVSGAGPFRPLTDEPSFTITAPYVASQPGAELDEPFVLASGPLLALWVTVSRPGDAHIEHADAFTLGGGFGLWQVALSADQPWESGVVQSPSAIWDSPWVLFYASGGAIGWAVGPDGHAWQKAPGPALFAEGPEGQSLTSPSAVRLGDVLRVYYVGNHRVWAAEAPWADIAAARATTWHRVDGDATTPALDPILDPTGLTVAASSATVSVTGVGRLTARAGLTPTGRVRHDLYLTFSTTGMPPADRACVFASSLTGDRFEVAPTPLLPLRESAHAPAETPYLDGALLLYVKTLGSHGAIAAATSP